MINDLIDIVLGEYQEDTPSRYTDKEYVQDCINNNNCVVCGLEGINSNLQGMPLCDEHYRNYIIVQSIVVQDFDQLAKISLEDAYLIDDSCLICKSVDEHIHYTNIPISENNEIESAFGLCSTCYSSLMNRGIELVFSETVECYKCKKLYQLSMALTDEFNEDFEKFMNINGYYYEILCIDCFHDLYKDFPKVLMKRCTEKQCKCNHISEINLLLYPPVCSCKRTLVINDTDYITFDIYDEQVTAKVFRKLDVILTVEEGTYNECLNVVFFKYTKLIND